MNGLDKKAATSTHSRRRPMNERDYFDWIFWRIGFATGSDCWKLVRFNNGAVWRRKMGAFWWRDPRKEANRGQ